MRIASRSCSSVSPPSCPFDHSANQRPNPAVNSSRISCPSRSTSNADNIVAARDSPRILTPLRGYSSGLDRVPTSCDVG